MKKKHLMKFYWYNIVMVILATTTTKNLKSLLVYRCNIVLIILSLV